MKHLSCIFLFVIIFTNSYLVYGQKSPISKLSEISEIPKGLDDCIVSYATSMEKLEQDQIIMLDGGNGIGDYFSFFEIDGELIKLELVEENRDDNSEGFTRIYKNESYTAKTEESYFKPAGYDSFYNKTTLELTINGKESITVSLIGLVSC